MNLRNLIPFLFLLVLGLAGCTEGPCDPGTVGCPCLSNATCRSDQLLCIDDLCVAPGALCEGDVCAPAQPKCYTPCTTDVLVEGGGVRRCPEDGLLEGCLGKNTCDRGSCVPVQRSSSGLSVSPGSCTRDTECPDYQTCIRGRCFSNCDADADCGAAGTCFRHVCRQKCSDRVQCAKEGQVCNFEGACIPLVAPSGTTPAVRQGEITVSTDRLRFDTNDISGEIVVRNGSSGRETITVRKVEEQITRADGTLTTQRVSDGDAPLPWLSMGVGTPLQVQQFPVTIPAGGEARILVDDARNEGVTRWTGALEISSPELGTKRVDLTYSERVEGRWAGTVYYFGNFEDGRTDTSQPLEDWRANRGDFATIDRVPNAFLQAWARFRNNQFSLLEMDALLQATTTESWKFDRVKQLCREAGFGANAVCAPFGGAGSSSVIPYTSAANINRVPSGVVELDFVLHLAPAAFEEAMDPTLCSRRDLDGNVTDQNCFVGRIHSPQTLQYGGNPKIQIGFQADPLDCQSMGGAGCINFLSDLGADIAVGGRYVPQVGEQGCERGTGLERMAFPWLVPGFTAPGGGDEKSECRDTQVPFGDAAVNKSFAGGNPIPDGRPRQRRLELIDGIMVEQRVMQLIVRETVDPFHGGEPFSAYAYIVLTRDDTDLDAAELRGNRPEDEREAPTDVLQTRCSKDLIAEVTQRPRDDIDSLPVTDLQRLALAVTTGASSTAAFTAFDPAQESIHYVCAWNEDAVIPSGSGQDEVQSQRREVFDNGQGNATSCPVGSLVVYFAIANADTSTTGDFDPSQDACNTNAVGSPENCMSRLQEFIRQGKRVRLMRRDRSQFPNAPPTTSFDLAFTCTPPGMMDPSMPAPTAVPVQATASCEDDRFDMRAGKTFFAQDESRIFFTPIETDIHTAFRYRTQFVGRTGANVGFAPVVCQDNATLTPYCYDTAGIEAITERVNCAIELYHRHLDSSIGAETGDLLKQYLIKNFGVLQFDNPFGDPILEQGFERLNAELLITLGDDAFTASFTSRFDLAGARQLAFEGSRFEVGGPDVSGGAGYELYKLYQAAQYYEMVLDRFYALTPLIWDNIQRDPTDRYITQSTVTSYLNRIIRASAQLSRANSEIARRYQGLNRSDLARVVIERAYTRAYQESIVVSALMDRLAERISPREADQIITEIDQAQRTYRVAMLDMRDRYERIDESLNPFGFRKDYIPFLALDEDSVNGFEPMLARAFERLDVAADFEERALQQSREFDVSEAEFQNELVTIANTYRERLGQLCGTFTGSDGRVYPAIPRYAHLSEDLEGLDDPCGATKTGAIWLKGADIETRALELQRVRTEISNILARGQIAEQWVARQCELIEQDVRLFLETQGVLDAYQNTIDGLEFTNRQLDKALEIAKTSETAGQIAGGVHLAATLALDATILSRQIKIRELEQAYEEYNIGRQCDYLTAELAFTLRGIHLDMNLLELDSLNAIWNLQVDTQLLEELDLERKRVTAEWDDAQQLAINAAAARADPNVRIYQNDAVINADRWFERALRDAYRATKIFEYYTNQTYADQEKLYLVRGVDIGDINLRNYLFDLEEDFFTFEEIFGNPDTRIEVLSLRDDIFRIPRYAIDGSGRPLTSEERVAMFRERIQSDVVLDRSGFITAAFSTDFSRLSPLTHNHKILFVEAEMFGEVGDDVARLYLRQKGTGVLKDSEGGRSYYTFPPRTAVINPVVNGFRDFGQDSDGAITGPVRTIFRSFRFRERPYVNSSWELVLNKRSEAVNEDINLAGLDDIVVRVFYTDFTNLED